MRIAQVAPLHESCPPKLYGGTERVVSYLTEELVRMGHEVTLFASGDSQTAARLRAPCPRALRLTACRDPIPWHVVLINRILRQADQFDIVHFHTDYLHFPAFSALAHKTLTTLHGRLDLPDLRVVFEEFPEMTLTSISWRQREPMADANWAATIHHGLPLDLHRPGRGEGGYLAFLGRLCPEKQPQTAIEIARRAGLPLRIAAKVDPVDAAFFESTIRTLLDQCHVDFLGEIGEAEKGDFLGGARALLFPIDWPEPFGLVTIEAMACGTPVIAYPRGAVPEAVDHGVTGFLVEGVDAAVEAVGRVGELDRRAIRAQFERRFSVTRMAEDYLAVYRARLERPWAANALPNLPGEPPQPRAA